MTRILAAVFFTILIMTGNTMAQSVRERIPELAIMKTLGFSDGKMTALVLAEALLLLVPRRRARHGGRLRHPPGLNRAIGSRFPPLYVTAETWQMGTLIVLALGLAIGLPPALRARTGCGSWTRWPGTAEIPAMRAIHQILEITLMNLRTLPQRLGTSLVVVVGIAGVVGVLVSVLAHVGGLPAHAREHRPPGPRDPPPRRVRRRAVERRAARRRHPAEHATRHRPRSRGRPLASAELVVMVDLPRRGESEPNNVPFRGVQPAAFAVRDELQIVEGRPFQRGVRR